MPSSQQSTMFEAFSAAESAARVGELPETMDAGVIAYRAVIDRFNAAMLAGDAAAVELAEEDAENIAAHLNGGTTFGMCAGEEASANVLDRLAAAPEGTIPIHGQAGTFVLELKGYSVRVEVDGMLAGCGGFQIHSLDEKACPITETGYRSFAGSRYGGVGGLAVEPFVRAVIDAHVNSPKKSKKKHRKGDSDEDTELWEN